MFSKQNMCTKVKAYYSQSTRLVNQECAQRSQYSINKKVREIPTEIFLQFLTHSNLITLTKKKITMAANVYIVGKIPILENKL